MSCIIRRKDKKSGTVYIYESVSYWDKDRKMSRSHRRLLGKEDPLTGELVPTGKRGPKPKAREQSTDGVATAAKTTNSGDRAATAHQKEEETIIALKTEVSLLKQQIKLIKTSFDQLAVQMEKCSKKMDDALAAIR